MRFRYDENPLDMIDRLPGRKCLAVEGEEPWLAACIILPDPSSEFERFVSVFWRIFADRGTLTIEASGKRYKLALEDQEWSPVIGDGYSDNFAELIPDYRKYLEECYGEDAKEQENAR